MAVEIEGLEFQIKVNTNKSAEGVDKLANSFLRLKSALKGGTGIAEQTKQLNRLNKALSGLKTEKLEELTKTSGVAKVNGDIADLSENMKRGNAFTRIFVSTLKRIDGFMGFSHVGRQLMSLPPKIINVFKNLKKMYQGFKEAGGVLGAFGRTVKAVATSLSSKLASGVRHVTSSLGNRFTSKIHGARKAIGGFISSLGRIAMYRAVRFALSALTQGFKEGTDNLYQYSTLMGGAFANNMNSLASNALYLKNSLGAMASPIINALTPAIEFVTDKIGHLFNMINQLIARLTGAKTYTAAKKVATTYGGAAEKAANTATKAAKKAVNEIKRYTLGFDELNILGEKKNPDSGTGGNGGGIGGNATPDYGSMFEELPIDSSISKFADRLKAAFQAGDWKELGTILGNKFNEIVDSVPWKKIGKKLGYGLNGAVQTSYHFLKVSDFKKLGKRIADLFNAGLKQIDFTFVGRLLIRNFTKSFDLLIGFLEGMDWKLVGKSVSDGIIGALKEAQEWMAGVDWSKMAKTLYFGIKDCITGIDFSEIVKSAIKLLATALAAQIEFAVTLISTTIKDIWKELKEHIFKYALNEDGSFKKLGEGLVTGILQGIVEGIKNIGSWIKENIFDPFIDGFKEVWGIHSPSTVMMEMGGFIVEGLLNGLLNSFKNVISWVGTTFEGIKNKILGVWETVKTRTSTIWQNIKTSLGTAWNTLKTNASTTWQNIKTTVSTTWDRVKTKTSTVWESVKTATGKIWDGLKTKAGKTWDNMKTTISKAWDKVRTSTDTTWSKLNTNLSKTWDKLKRNASDVFKSVKETITDKIGDARDAVGEGVERMKGALDFDWHLPHIPLPHFGITGHFGLNPPSIPHFSVDWYKTGGILEGAQLFGMMGNTMLGGGEAGREAVLPLETHTEWMDILAHKVRAGLTGTNSDSIADGVREGMYDATARQNELLKEQNDLLRQIAGKDFSTTITTSSITNALNRKNQRDGKTIIPVGI